MENAVIDVCVKMNGKVEKRNYTNTNDRKNE